MGVNEAAMSQTAPPTPTDPAPTDSAPSPKQMRAAAQLAIWGVCRTSGDDYLACVALRGKGQCQALRHVYEGCMRGNVREAFAALEGIGDGACRDENASRNEKRECAADHVIAKSGGTIPW